MTPGPFARDRTTPDNFVKWLMAGGGKAKRGQRLGMFAGDRDGSASYIAREKVVRESVLSHGRILAGPSSWRDRPGYMLFQGPKTAKTTGYEKS
jgi:hypothetical protein